jgi:hypothetical protein
MIHLLKEWVDAQGNKIVLNSTTSSVTTTAATATVPSTTATTVSYKDKFKKVANQVTTTQKWCDIEELTDRTLELVFGYGRTIYQLNISIRGNAFDVLFQKIDPDTDVIGEFTCDSWRYVLNYLKSESLIRDVSICESASISTIDEFKIYEDLWELTEAKADTQRQL